MLSKLRSKLGTLFLAGIFFVPTTLSATSVNEYEKRTPDEQGDLLRKMVNKAAASIEKSNPQLAQRIRDFFFKMPASGKGVPEGTNHFLAEMAAYEILAHQGKADLDKVQVEAIVVDVIKEKFAEQSKRQPPK